MSLIDESAYSHLEQSAFEASPFADKFNKAVQDFDWQLTGDARNNGSAQAVLPELTLTKNNVAYNDMQRPWDQTWVRDAGQTDAPKKIEFITNAADGYDKGVQERKAIVMFFGENGKWSQEMDKELDKEEFQKLSGSAAFSKVKPSTDVVAANMASALGIDHYPTISVFSPNGSMLDEVGRIVGYFDAATVATKVGEYISKVNNKLNAQIPSV